MDSSGESSCKRREDGDDDVAEGPKHPLKKKARFAWQVKGKHHLKRADINKTSNSTSNDLRPDNIETVNDQIPLKNGSSCDVLRNEFQRYVEREEKRTLEPSVDQGSSSMLSNNNTTNYQYPRYISSDRMSYNNDNNNTRRRYYRNQYQELAEDHCIAQWQAKQMVTSCIDNTINHVLDRWVNVPLQTGPVSVTNALNMAQFVNHLPGDNTVENEGILMAISAHGLQNANGDEDKDTNLGDSPESNSEILRLTSLPQEGDVENGGPSHNDDYRNSSDMEDQMHIINTAVLYAINSKGLTASGTDYG